MARGKKKTQAELNQVNGKDEITESATPMEFEDEDIYHDPEYPILLDPLDRPEIPNQVNGKDEDIFHDPDPILLDPLDPSEMPKVEKPASEDVDSRGIGGYAVMPYKNRHEMEAAMKKKIEEEKKTATDPVAEPEKTETPAAEAPKINEAVTEPIKTETPVPEKPKRGRKAAEKKPEDKAAPEKKAKGGRKPKAEKKAEEKVAVAENTPAPAPEKLKRGRKPAAEKKSVDKPVAEKKTRGGRKPAAEKKAPEKAAVKEKPKKEPKAKKPAAEKKTPTKKAAPAAKAVSDSFVIQSNGKDYTMDSIKELCKDKFRNGTRKQVKSTDVYLNVYNGKLRAYYVINGEGGEDFYIDL